MHHRPLIRQVDRLRWGPGLIVDDRGYAFPPRGVAEQLIALAVHLTIRRATRTSLPKRPG